MRYVCLVEISEEDGNFNLCKFDNVKYTMDKNLMPISRKQMTSEDIEKIYALLPQMEKFGLEHLKEFQKLDSHI